MTEALLGKVAVVTGASSGIGREMARGLAQRGASVWVVSRGTGEGARVAEALRTSSGNDAVTFLPADLSSLAEVRDVAERLVAAAPRIDILANNAGAYFIRRQRTVDGYEATFALNHLAPFLLTQRLLPALLRAPEARVVVTSSAASRAGRLRLDDPMFERRYDGWAAYSQSKLANLAFTTTLARRLEGTSVTVNAFHPGFVDSGFGEGTSVTNHLFRLAVRLFARSPEQGADSGLYLALAPELTGVSGVYVADRKRATPKAAATDPVLGERLWRLSEQLVGLTDQERAVLSKARPAA